MISGSVKVRHCKVGKFELILVKLVVNDFLTSVSSFTYVGSCSERAAASTESASITTAVSLECGGARILKIQPVHRGGSPNCVGAFKRLMVKMSSWFFRDAPV